MLSNIDFESAKHIVVDYFDNLEEPDLLVMYEVTYNNKVMLSGKLFDNYDQARNALYEEVYAVLLWDFRDRSFHEYGELKMDRVTNMSHDYARKITQKMLDSKVFKIVKRTV